MKRVTLVDICWTLFLSNTTMDFLDFVIQKRAYRGLRWFYRSRVGYRLNVAVYRLLKVDVQRRLAVRYLRGYDERTLDQLAEQFYEEYLEKRRIEKVWERLPQTGVVLVSGTLDVIAKTVAARIGAEGYFASRMEYKEGKATGRFEDVLLRKQEIGERYPSFDVVTDNLSDIDLVKGAEKATVVTYGNRARWEKALRGKEVSFVEVKDVRY